MLDALGDRLKGFYENRTRFYLPRKTYSILRIDGKTFHNWTKGLKRPFDPWLMDIMDETTKELCSKIQGSVFAYTQSDEINILIIDFDPSGKKLTTAAWFDGNIQKMSSVGASLTTAIFNNIILEQYDDDYIRDHGFATFDARVFTIPDPIEVYNLFVWRQQDNYKNAVQMAVRHFYSAEECHGKSCAIYDCWL